MVSTVHSLSGVNNRNHCPYCLWSCHLDLFAAGDRLSACKAAMKPIGLTMKKGRNKYQLRSRGELMLVHECIECRALSINRIAADDDAETIMEVFQVSITLERQVLAVLIQNGIDVLKAEDAGILHTQLYGRNVEIPVPVWN
jgi:hypothetical protein